MATTPPERQRAEDLPTGGPLDMLEAFPLTIGVQLAEDAGPEGSRFRATLVIGPIFAGAPTVDTLAAVGVPGNCATREEALRAAARHIASKLS